MMKIFKGILLTIAFMMVATVCLADDKIKVALVIPSTIDDLAWSQAMYEGLKAAQQELGADKLTFEVSERLWNAVDAGAAIRQYAMHGFNIIIAHGAQYQSLLTEIAPDFPKISFAYGTGFATPEKNIFAYDPHAQEGAYLLGILAGLTTKSNIIGIVGPVEAGDAIKYNKGFEQGVKSVNKDAQVRIAYTGSFGDLVAAAEIARTQIKAGADVLTGTSQQSVGAINIVAEQKGLYWLASDMDQKSIAPNTVLAAQAYTFKNVIMEIIDSRAKGVYGGKHLELSLANGGLQLVFNDKIIGNIPAGAEEAVLEAKAKIIDGSLKIDIK
ncbi:BMP family ABC transporter substrate-binding protein [Desulfopila sp. IMCC35006]|uniref:BMP family lipoprotein n=1 Tax=Desulfopila sp. IMCC35006 TaxID=2569542 RepID=UPI0010AC0AE5|nr:BMP family protein [Desulfopila sp. IMCC35006]TKB23280.1 BMP family ABC transporter substrate-binding protein [Desulfopila sp. IMCC35006]